MLRVLSIILTLLALAPAAWPAQSGGDGAGPGRRLPETLAFGPDDSGTAQGRMVYAAHPDETPVFIDGRRIGGWDPGKV